MVEDWFCSQPGCGLLHSDHLKEREEAIITNTHIKTVNGYPIRKSESKLGVLYEVEKFNPTSFRAFLTLETAETYAKSLKENTYGVA